MKRFSQSIRLFIYTAFIAAALPLSSAAQWKAISYKQEFTDTAYDIRTDTGFHEKKDFVFPEYSWYENINSLSGAVECMLPASEPAWHKSFDKDIDLMRNSSAVSLRIYTENIRQYTYFLYSAHARKWLSKVVALPFDGYQIPTTEKFSTWSDSGAPPAGTASSPGSSDIPPATTDNSGDQLSIRVTPADTSLPWKFVIGDLLIGHYQRIAYPVTHPFFSNLNAPTEATPGIIAASYHHPLHSDYFEKIPSGMDTYGLSASIDILPDESHRDSASDRLLLRRIIASSLKYYPFYKERKLDRSLIAKDIDGIFASPRTGSYCSLVDSLDEFIRHTFDDHHFYLDYPGDPCRPAPAGKQRSPVRIVTLNGKYLIGAVFDTAYNRIHIDDLVIAIDGVPVQQAVDREAVRLYGSTHLSDYEKYAITSSLLDRGRNDSCRLRTRGATTSAVSGTVIRYDKKYSIPDNFRPVHAEYRRYGDIAYFRINYWEEAVYLRFINHWDDIRNVRKIIIDLRGNLGGEMTAAMQLFAVFIHQPKDYYWNIDQEGQPIAVRILPDKYFSYPSSGKVVILGDQSTACASESFIKAMQNSGSAIYVGAGKTAGTFASKFDISLPSGVIVHVNSLLDKAYYQPGLYELEGKGIAPDLLVKIDRVEDLRPYNDKILREAIKILSADKTGLAENRQKE
ncbi:MAG TPA: S41 family peptidase [Puia sp.]|jgi:C-terminal processing protease CtpA/Prc|nr:S41 family peptidase [Puia sp.]